MHLYTFRQFTVPDNIRYYSMTSHIATKTLSFTKIGRLILSQFSRHEILRDHGRVNNSSLSCVVITFYNFFSAQLQCQDGKETQQNYHPRKTLCWLYSFLAYGRSQTVAIVVYKMHVLPSYREIIELIQHVAQNELKSTMNYTVSHICM